MRRFRKRVRSLLAVVIPAALLAAGIYAGPLLSEEWRWRSVLLSEVQELTELEAVRALPRTEAVLATLEAQHYLQAGRPYAAWETLQRHIDLDGTTGQSVNLLAAQSAAVWGGWSEARDVLEGREWLASAAAGEGLLLLARSYEELGSLEAAVGAYRDYLTIENATLRGQAQARLAGVLSRRGQHLDAAQAYAAAATALPDIADWLQVLQVEQLVDAGDPTATAVATSLSGGSAPVRRRRVELEAEGWVASAESDRAIHRLDWEARILNAEGARLEAAQLHLARARLLLRTTEPAAGRELLASVASNPALPANARLEAAQLLNDQSGRTMQEELAMADAYEAANRPGLAARSLREAFDLGAPDGAEPRLRLARLLYAERDYGPARTAHQRAAELLESPDLQAEARMYAARALLNSGSKQNALTELRSVVERYPGTAAAGTALYLLGDAATTTQAGLGYYRQAAALTSSPDARESLYRVGDRSLRLKETAAAIQAWEEYVRRYPQGEQTARVAYEVGKLHDAAGRRVQAQAMYTAATRAEPTSYYAVRAAGKLDVSSVDHLLANPEPWVGLASEPGEATAVLRRMDRLEELGLMDARDAEYQSALRNFAEKPLAKIVLAEGLVERNRPVEAIGLGRDLLAQRQGRWDERLLRVVFPFPYQQLIVEEAARADVDPILYAALVRQESSFRADAKSWVGATGLGQIMPATGSWLAPAVGIRNYRHSMLVIPEVNLRMGTKYLGDLLDRYDGAADLALAGYNAGPGRADRWRRQFNYGRDTDAFRAAIPFDETRNYVTIVIRNAAIYESLYRETVGGEPEYTD